MGEVVHINAEGTNVTGPSGNNNKVVKSTGLDVGHLVVGVDVDVSVDGQASTNGNLAVEIDGNSNTSRNRILSSTKRHRVGPQLLVDPGLEAVRRQEQRVLCWCSWCK